MNDDIEKISLGFAEAIKEARDTSVDTDIDSQRRTRRQRLMDNWSVEQGRHIAAAEGIDLDDARLQVVNCLRDYYLQHGDVDSGRTLGEMLDLQFSKEGGRKYLRTLFPLGPVAQGMRIAGLDVPDYTENDGFGTAR